jgi:hypothetical protein
MLISYGRHKLRRNQQWRGLLRALLVALIVLIQPTTPIMAGGDISCPSLEITFTKADPAKAAAILDAHLAGLFAKPAMKYLLDLGHTELVDIAQSTTHKTEIRQAAAALADQMLGPGRPAQPGQNRSEAATVRQRFEQSAAVIAVPIQEFLVVRADSRSPAQIREAGGFYPQANAILAANAHSHPVNASGQGAVVSASRRGPSVFDPQGPYRVNLTNDPISPFYQIFRTHPSSAGKGTVLRWRTLG